MKDFYQVIILTLKRFAIFNSNYLIIHTPVFLLNSNEIKINEKIISFDYLIFDNIKLISNYLNSIILHDHTIPITNYFNATSIENIFYTNDIFHTLELIENEEF